MNQTQYLTKIFSVSTFHNSIQDEIQRTSKMISRDNVFPLGNQNTISSTTIPPSGYLHASLLIPPPFYSLFYSYYMRLGSVYRKIFYNRHNDNPRCGRFLEEGTFQSSLSLSLRLDLYNLLFYMFEGKTCVKQIQNKSNTFLELDKQVRSIFFYISFTI